MIATPAQMVEAWECGVMSGTPKRAAHEVQQHKPTVPDPIFHRDDEEGWRTASGIVNPSAMNGIRSYLTARGLSVPPATEAAWQATLKDLDLRNRVEAVVNTAIRSVGQGASLSDFTTALRDAVERLEKE